MQSIIGRVGILMVLLTAAPVAAQDVGVSASVELAAGASPRQMLDFVEQALNEMNQAITGLTALQREAEKSGDADAVDCVAAKLRTVTNMRDVSAGLQGNISEALASGLVGQADHLARRIGVAVDIVRRVSAEAQACVGDASGSEGEDIRDGEADREGGTDETDPLSFEDELGEDPPNTSPF
jgi:hypothetical protein